MTENSELYYTMIEIVYTHLPVLTKERQKETETERQKDTQSETNNYFSIGRVNLFSSMFSKRLTIG